MDEIIRDEFEKFLKYMALPLFEEGRAWRAFVDGWKCSEQWHERQNMMDRDSLEQTKEEARLAQGG